MPVQFRNVDATPTDPVDTWPYEALATVVERGLVADWQPVFTEIRRSPWGEVARRVERIIDRREPDGVSIIFTQAIERARAAMDRADRDVAAARIREAVARSGLTSARFAQLMGTSASRLSTYATGRVTPSAALLVRIERLASAR